MGHMVEIVIVAVVALAIFGPKALQEIARNTGKGVSQANTMKAKFMADMPIKELNSVAETISRVPASPAQAMQMMMKNTLSPEEKPAKKASEKVVESSTSKVVLSPIEEPKTEI